MFKEFSFSSFINLLNFHIIYILNHSYLPYQDVLTGFVFHAADLPMKSLG